MKKLKKTVVTLLFVVSAAFVFAGCGTNDDMEEQATVSESTDYMQNQADATKETSQENSKEEKDTGTTQNVGENLEDAAEDVGDAAEDAVDDVADGVGDAIDNLGGGSFDSYEEAKTYLLNKLKKDNEGANYEVRDETEELTAYNNNDSGAEGYQFSVYETDGNEKIGIYYVDKNTGKIYRYMGKNAIEAY